MASTHRMRLRSGLLALALLAAPASGANALHDAVLAEEPDGLRAGLRRGLDPEERDALGYTVLMRAANDGMLEAVRILLEAGVDVNARDNSRATALHLVVENGMEDDHEIVRLLLGRGAELEAADQFGWTPLHAAASRGHAEMITLLLDAGASAAATDEEGKTPLAWAASGGHEAASALLDEHALRRLAAKGAERALAEGGSLSSDAGGEQAAAAPPPTASSGPILSGRPLSAAESAAVESAAAAKLMGERGKEDL